MGQRKSMSGKSVSVPPTPDPPVEVILPDEADEAEEDEKELTEEDAAKAALYKWAKETFPYSKDKDCVTHYSVS